MTGPRKLLRIGFIPLVDAAALIVAADMGFAAAEGLEIELVREVSWSNVRDKLNIGLFDAAHLLAPMAIASSLGLGCVRVPIAAPFALAMNGNAITVSPALFAELAAAAEGDLSDPLKSAQALASVASNRRRRGDDPLTFGMTFPFSSHNYLLRYWMAAGGLDPDEDVRLVVLPPPFMVESLAKAQVDGFCVGAPWNSIAVINGVGRILHFSCEIFARAAEKVLALRESFAEADTPTVTALTRAHQRAADFINDLDNCDEIASLLARPNRIGVAAHVIQRTLHGRLMIAPNGAAREDENYLILAKSGAGRPDPIQAAWLYAQMQRWGQAQPSPELLEAAKRTFRADLFDASLESPPPTPVSQSDSIGAFAGPVFDADNVAAYLSEFPIGCKE
jgi:ABC-type nitrate/sulfonate/bicarbonate transport system substrate-binding protein